MPLSDHDLWPGDDTPRQTGFLCFSLPTGFDSKATARKFHKLMNRLGSKEYYLQGEDWGSLITTNMAQMLPQWVAKGISAEKVSPVLTLPSGSTVRVLPSVCPASHRLLLCFLQGYPHPCAFSHIHVLCIDSGICILTLSKFHRIIEAFRLEKTLKIIESNHKPNTAKSTAKPGP